MINYFSLLVHYLRGHSDQRPATCCLFSLCFLNPYYLHMILYIKTQQVLATTLAARPNPFSLLEEGMARVQSPARLEIVKWPVEGTTSRAFDSPDLSPISLLFPLQSTCRPSIVSITPSLPPFLPTSLSYPSSVDNLISPKRGVFSD